MRRGGIVGCNLLNHSLGICLLIYSHSVKVKKS